MREKYESLSVGILKELAKARGIKGVSVMKKNDVVEAMLALDEKEEQEKRSTAKENVREYTKDTAKESGVEPEAEKNAAAERRTSDKQFLHLTSHYQF